jgi:hypothetical protein
MNDEVEQKWTGAIVPNFKDACFPFISSTELRNAWPSLGRDIPSLNLDLKPVLLSYESGV